MTGVSVIGLGAMGMMRPHSEYFAPTALDGNFDDPPATMKSYAFALEDELPRLFVDMVNKGIDAGLEDKALTALVPFLAEEGET